jgi:O-antigen/teichoic acid export membrane protein
MKFPHVWTRIAIVAFGVGLGPLVQLLATPLLARTFSPADFGQLALFTSVVSILTVVSCLRYEGAIQVVEDAHIDAIIWAALLVVGLTFVVGMVGLHLRVVQNSFESLYNLAGNITWVAIVAASAGTILVASNLTMRTNRYVKNALVRSGVSVLFVALALGVSGISLLHANAIAFAIVGVAALAFLWTNIGKFNVGETMQIAREYLKYPFLLAPTSLLDAVALTLPVLFISGSYGMDSTGHYAQIQRLIGAPMLFAGVVAGQLFAKRSGELFRAGQSSRPLLWKVVRNMTLLGLLVILAIAWFGEPICMLILGRAWRFDTQFLLLASVPLVVRSVISPVSTVFLTHNHTWVAVAWQVVYFSLSFAGLQYAASTMSFERFLLAYGFIELISYLSYLLLGHKVSTTKK